MPGLFRAHRLMALLSPLASSMPLAVVSDFDFFLWRAFGKCK